MLVENHKTVIAISKSHTETATKHCALHIVHEIAVTLHLPVTSAQLIDEACMVSAEMYPVESVTLHNISLQKIPLVKNDHKCKVTAVSGSIKQVGIYICLSY